MGEGFRGCRLCEEGGGRGVVTVGIEREGLDFGCWGGGSIGIWFGNRGEGEVVSSSHHLKNRSRMLCRFMWGVPP